MSTFEEIVTGLDISASVTCDGCEESTATVRVTYACESESELLCAACFIAYGAGLVRTLREANAEGMGIAHAPCDTSLSDVLDIAIHVRPVNISDGKAFDPSPEEIERILRDMR